ncbi:MAG: 2-oxoacid:acceptor oxidoreductase family protein [Candidatus Magnetoovum sp. WYHC-5]|nr:2-oxoacid:acceptor oxidoreductase family protein [Candidatus Magnetoovum sp. WYHC-5]
MVKRFLIGGSGGQGILFMGKVIAYAAMYRNQEVTWFPSYGAEMRGGAANCIVIMSDEPIGSPVFHFTDYLIVFNEAAYKRYIPRLRDNGVLFYDESLFQPDARLKVHTVAVKATKIAKELGNIRVANMIMAGALASVTKIFNKDELLHALDGDKSECTLNALPLNKQAILKGFDIVDDKKSLYS